MRIVLLNSAFKDWLHRLGVKTDILGKTVFEAFPFLSDKVRAEYAHVFDTRETLFTEESNLLDGVEIITETRKIPIIKEGRVDQVITVVRDITINKINEKKIKESEEKYRSLFDRSPYYILLIDEQWKIFDCNPATKDILGYTKEELINKNLYDIFLPDPNTENILKQRTKAIINDKRLNPIEIKIRRKNGTEIEVKTQSSLVQIGNQKYIQIIGQDITDNKLKELELIRSEKKYCEAYNRAEFYKDLFAHDMSNALQGILSAHDLIKIYIEKGSKLKEILEMFNIIQEQIDKSVKLISNIQKLSRLEKNHLVIKKIELISLLNDTIKVASKSFSNKQIKIQVFKSSEKIVVNADELLQDVFENLLSNAIRYNDNMDVEIIIKITIIKEDEKNFCKVEFIDNGNGIIDDQKISIFQRAQDPSKNARGLGLGLFLVYKIVSSYNGRIWVEDRIKGDYSKGSNFIVLIPKPD